MKPITQLKWFKKQSTVRGVLTMLAKLYENPNRHLKKCLFEPHNRESAVKVCAIGGVMVFATDFNLERKTLGHLHRVTNNYLLDINNGRDGYRRIRVVLRKAIAQEAA